MSNRRKPKLPPVISIIGHDTEVDGGLQFTDSLHVDGVVHGDALAREDRPSGLTVSHGGRIEGNVRTQHLRLDGTILGDVYVTRRVELGAHAVIQGDVYYGMLEMAMGAEVNGRLSRIVDPETNNS